MTVNDVKNPNKYRLLRVFEYMQDTDAEHPLNVTQIIEKLQQDDDYEKEPDRKSIMRDLAAIEACGYELAASENHNKGKYMIHGKHITSKPLENYQLKLLADVVKSAHFLSCEDAQRLVQKIMELATPTGRESLQKTVVEDYSLNVGDKKTKLAFNNVLEAILNKKQLRFQYNDKFLPNPQNEDLRYEGFVYHISPYYLVPVNNDYYVIANIAPYDDFCHFRLSRMVNVQLEEVAARKITSLASQKQLESEGKAIKDYLREHINMWFGETQFVQLHCRQQRRLDVFAKFGNELKMYDCPENKEYFSVSVKVPASDGFFGWVASFGRDVVIAGPNIVREEYKEYLLAMLHDYLPHDAQEQE